ncbi:BREX-1 system adenine-specific DNA-methyltransferase PglX [Clostridium estertheticum]|uniref:BREX-1 system adenine-specific DNA-methyltransferase PglX n=1 Tax=Clostridium estertheticum TaxID=238834 RepID=UPI0013E94087|nr:BREX-1 system adenine-specific DNA-methyltransferase PglX [Clostridium estertheticum]MBZ9684973.1 BREX-1 system adenine-specific DNA-methyltransferase PglX [Clostridium estertheticum]
MNKNALKIFAIESRKELIEKIQIKAMQYGIEKDKIKNSQTVSSDSIVINGKPLSKEEKLQREKLITKIRDINEKGEDGYSSAIEEVAYTWFNRFTALRFMEVNNYMPTRVRALSSATEGSVEPDLIKEASNVDLPVDKQKIYEMKLNNDMEGLFKYMIIAQCNSLNKTLPFMFQKIGDYTELLLPDGLLNEGSFVRKLTETKLIEESDWEDVEIIGWLYQYYNSDEKDRVIQAKKKYTKEEIPFATQLFTPDWIVRYMVQNSLGRYWVESHPEHRELKKNWEFYLESPNGETEFEDKLAPYINKDLKVEDIKCFDPACGSGHILVYMFDMLYQVYEKCGYMSREIPKLIIENNIYGLDIDDRAYQLACFAVIMKGMKYNNRLLRNIEKDGIKINIASIQETNNLNDDDIEYIAGGASGENYDKTKAFIKQFEDAKIYGSLIKVEEVGKGFLEKRCDYISNNPVEKIEYQSSKNKQVDELLEKLIKQADIMIKTYDVLVTNPPYMGSKFMSSELTNYIKNNYNDVKSDLFSAFMDYSFKKVHNNGHLGFMTPFVWMFISTYEKLREMIINNFDISSLIQLEYSGFEEATVPICTLTLRNYSNDLSGEYIRLSDFPGSHNQPIKTLESISKPNCGYRYSSLNKDFSRVPGSPIAYWANEKIRVIFEKEQHIKDIAYTCIGMRTGDNSRFLRLWYEVNNEKTGFAYSNNIDAKKSKFKWFPYNKGGEFRKWYGNQDFVVNWENDGEEIKKETRLKYPQLGENLGWKISNEKFYFKKSITWSFISSSKFGVRYSPNGFIFDVAGSSVFPKEEDIFYLMAFLCSKLAFEFLKMQNPTLNFQVVNIASLPLILPKSKIVKEKIDYLAKSSIDISKNDWDSLETSWDFKKHTILAFKDDTNIIDIAYQNCNEFAEKQFYLLKENEEELNRMFIEIYGLHDEMTPEVEEKDVTIRKADREKDIKSLISYAVGCMFGRYSLDQDGLVYAGGEFNSTKYTTFKAYENNIIPILSDSYFEYDIVAKFVEFVKVTFGKETLSENLTFIAETLGNKNSETAKDTIRRYFLNDFFKDHVQTYKKRPIYWLFTSGKQKAFNCLIYMHRYDRNTLSSIRTDYLHELQDRLDTESRALVDVREGDYSTKEKSEAKKKLTLFDKQIDELKKYDEVLHHMADMQIEIDLDDGVIANYEKFKGLLAKI